MSPEHIAKLVEACDLIDQAHSRMTDVPESEMLNQEYLGQKLIEIRLEIAAEATNI